VIEVNGVVNEVEEPCKYVFVQERKGVLKK